MTRLNSFQTLLVLLTFVSKLLLIIVSFYFTRKWTFRAVARVDLDKVSLANTSFDAVFWFASYTKSDLFEWPNSFDLIRLWFVFQCCILNTKD